MTNSILKHSGSLELRYVINFARDAENPLEWPSYDVWRQDLTIWWRRFNDLKNEIDLGHLSANLRGPVAHKGSRVQLDKLWSFAVVRDHNWEWLRQFCQEWATARDVDLPQNSRATTIGAENRCQEWLVGLMSASDDPVKPKKPKKPKKEYRTKAINKFNVSIRGFDRAWANAIAKTGKTNWSGPGRKS